MLVNQHGNGTSKSSLSTFDKAMFASIAADIRLHIFADGACCQQQDDNLQTLHDVMCPKYLTAPLNNHFDITVNHGCTKQ